MKELIIIVLILYGIYLLMKYLLPRILTTYIRRASRKFQDEASGQDQQRKRKEGEVHIDYIPEKKKKKPDQKNDEYVDFEEIE